MVILKVENLYKKFTQDIKYNMYYGIRDLLSFSKDSLMKEELRVKEFWAVKNVSFNINKGEICGVIGENGSGKTTLMRIIAGIYPYSKGIIHSPDYTVITPIFAVKAGINPLFTGYENILILGSMYGMTESQIDNQISFIEEFSELGKKLNSPAGNYSSGMKARLGYTVAAATNPDLFIVDEALAVGDIAFRKKCFTKLRVQAKEEGKSVLFVTNNNLKIDKIASRVIVMKRGQIVKDTKNIGEAMNFYASAEYSNFQLS